MAQKSHRYRTDSSIVINTSTTGTVFGAPSPNTVFGKMERQIEFIEAHGMGLTGW
jgi:hypothetical protein